MNRSGNPGAVQDAYIGTKPQWTWKTIQEWLHQADDDLAKLYPKE